MRKLYLIRHGKPDLPPGSHICLGHTDPGLSVEGHRQAAALAGRMREYPVTEVFCSPLLRSRQTAAYLSEHPVIVPGLEEQDQGEWDGLSFSEIRQKWPELYERRGVHPELNPPGAEDSEKAVLRFQEAIAYILSVSHGNIAVVAHRSVIRLFLCKILKKKFSVRNQWILDYTSVTTLLYEDGKYLVESIGVLENTERK